MGKRFRADFGFLSGMVGFQSGLEGGGQGVGYLGRGPVTLLKVGGDAGVAFNEVEDVWRGIHKGSRFQSLSAEGNAHFRCTIVLTCVFSVTLKSLRISISAFPDLQSNNVVVFVRAFAVLYRASSNRGGTGAV